MYPEGLRYTEESLWVKVEDGNKVRTGITYFYQAQIKKTIFVEFPEEEAGVKKGEPFGSLESSKSINDLLSPVSGKVIAVNHKLDTNPGLTNSDPYGEGWMALIELSNPEEVSTLMTAGDYEAFIKQKLPR
jgi:glycine cleavage system H protein